MSFSLRELPFVQQLEAASGGSWLNMVSALSTPTICLMAIIHFLALLWLVAWASRDLRRMVIDLETFTLGLKHRSVLASRLDLSDQIDAFISDVSELLERPAAIEDRRRLLERVSTLDERKSYLQSQSFDTMYNVCRTMIEAYPLAGVLGTIVAIGAALQGGGGGGEQTVALIVRYFGDAIWSTFAGLLAAMALMFFNSLIETKFDRLGANRASVRETIARVKRELSLSLASDRASIATERTPVTGGGQS